MKHPKKMGGGNSMKPNKGKSPGAMKPSGNNRPSGRGARTQRRTKPMG